MEVNDQSLVLGENPRLSPTRFEDWLSRTISQKKAMARPFSAASNLTGKVAQVAALPFCDAAAQDSSTDNARVTLVYEHVLPNVPRKSMKDVLVEYPPGGSSPAHTHPRSAFICATVLAGAIRSQVNDGPVTVYRAGESFSEMPDYERQMTAIRPIKCAKHPAN